MHKHLSYIRIVHAFVLITLLNAGSAWPQGYTFTTLAGAQGGAAFDDGTGRAAPFRIPYGVATDANGNVYVADTANNTIRKIAPGGVATTLAGLVGVGGSADGTQSAARFNNPYAVAADKSGNVYVADSYNHTIRKITAAGVVTTLAGVPGIPGSADGIGSAARFFTPFGLATDNGGNVYVADTENHTIRKITPAGTVTTFAGLAGFLGGADGIGNAARFNAPYGVATDDQGNVYVADTGSHTIRKITSAGLVMTLAGNSGFPGSADGTGSAARFWFPYGVTADRSANVYVADTSNNTIRKISPAGVVTTLAGMAGRAGSADGTGSAAEFRSPAGLSADVSGNVYVADTFNNVIREVTPLGTVSTFAGLAGSSGSADGTGSAARFNNPYGLVADSRGDAYVADLLNHTIRRITAAGVVTTLAGVAGDFGIADGSGSDARFFGPSGITADSSGTKYVADTSNHTIRAITSTGAVTTLAGFARTPGSTDGAGNAARFRAPQGVTTDTGGNIYVADTLNHTIRKIAPGGSATTLAGLAGSSGGEDGTGSAARFNVPRGIATDASGNVYVADTNNHTIRKITPSGAVTTLAGVAGSFGSADGIGRSARFYRPVGVAADTSGNIYVADSGNSTIRKVTAAGAVTTIAGLVGSFGSADGTGDVARFNSPYGVAIDSNETIYVADTFNNTIRIGTPALADSATIDSTSGSLGASRQLGTNPSMATTWQWRIIRSPVGSTAALSSPSIRNPSFIPDATGTYVIRLTASDGTRTSITAVSLVVTSPALRRRAVFH